MPRRTRLGLGMGRSVLRSRYSATTDPPQLERLTPPNPPSVLVRDQVGMLRNQQHWNARIAR